MAYEQCRPVKNDSNDAFYNFYDVLFLNTSSCCEFIFATNQAYAGYEKCKGRRCH